MPLLHGEQCRGAPAHSSSTQARTTRPNDPDVQTQGAAIRRPIEAIRSSTFTYVHYVNGDTEYYDRNTDPYELHNLGPTLARGDRPARLDSGRADALHTAAARNAGRPGGPSGV